MVQAQRDELLIYLPQTELLACGAYMRVPSAQIRKSYRARPHSTS